MKSKIHLIVLTLAALCPMSASAQSELVQNGSFAKGMSKWQLETHSDAGATAEAKTTEGDGTAICVTVPVSPKHGYDVQLVQSVFKIPMDQKLRLTFRARGESKISVGARRPSPPWTVYWKESVELTPDWQDYSYTITLPQSSTSMRLDFFGFGAPGEYWLADVSLTVQE